MIIGCVCSFVYEYNNQRREKMKAFIDAGLLPLHLLCYFCPLFFFAVCFHLESSWTIIILYGSALILYATVGRWRVYGVLFSFKQIMEQCTRIHAHVLSYQKGHAMPVLRLIFDAVGIFCLCHALSDFFYFHCIWCRYAESCCYIFYVMNGFVACYYKGFLVEKTSTFYFIFLRLCSFFDMQYFNETNKRPLHGRKRRIIHKTQSVNLTMPYKSIRLVMNINFY